MIRKPIAILGAVFSLILVFVLFFFIGRKMLGLGNYPKMYINLGECMQWGMDLPKTFPSSVPLYSPSSLFVSFVDCNMGKQNIITVHTTPNSDLNIKAFYELEMPKRGWILKDSLNETLVKKLVYGTNAGQSLEIRIENVVPLKFMLGNQANTQITIKYTY